MYRLRRLDTGVTLATMATIEDATGKLTVSRNVVFWSDSNSVWTSPATHIAYPLHWIVDIGNMRLSITPDVQDQEMPVLANKGAIWEGSASVVATENPAVSAANGGNGPETSTHGTGYMELVGYSAKSAHPAP
jgi:predicted secreted hydrolase